MYSTLWGVNSINATLVGSIPTKRTMKKTKVQNYTEDNILGWSEEEWHYFWYVQYQLKVVNFQPVPPNVMVHYLQIPPSLIVKFSEWLRYGVIGNTTDFGSVIGESYSSASTNFNTIYDTRHNTLFGRGLPETT